MNINKEIIMQRKGFCIILSGPSGAGKTSLMKALMEQDLDLYKSTSFTTRNPRPGEHEGEDYFFVTQHTFEAAKACGDFLETVTLYNYAYGTPWKPINPLLEKGKDVILCLDEQGMECLKAHFPQQSVSIYILPPSLSVLHSRLSNRDAMLEKRRVEERLKNVEKNIKNHELYDYALINDDFQDSLHALKAIINAERSRAYRINMCIHNTPIGTL